MSDRGDPSTYIHGTHAVEQARLARMNGLINPTSLAMLDLCGGEKILDVGGGLGQFARTMARAVGPAGRVVSVERSGEQIARAHALAALTGEEGTVEIRQGNVEALPLAEGEWGGFDIAHARFILEHLPEPLTVVRQMVRAVRPGGRVVLEDDDHEVLRLWPEPAHFRDLWSAYMESFTRVGNDPLTGRRLVEFLHAAGARPRRNTWLFFGSCAGAPDFTLLTDNLAGVLEGAAPALVRLGLYPEDRFMQAMTSLREWTSRPDAAFWYARAWAAGVRP
jgi:SAM-dependent methyltransferase